MPQLNTLNVFDQLIFAISDVVCHLNKMPFGIFVFLF